MIKTTKIKLLAVGNSPEQKKISYDYIKNVAGKLAKIGNEVIRLHIQNQYTIEDIKQKNGFTKRGDAQKFFQEKIGMSLQNEGYRLLTNYPEISSQIRTCFNQEIYGKMSKNFHDIVNGKMSIPSFRKSNISIPFSAQNDKNTKITNSIYMEEGKYYTNFPLSSKNTEKEIKLFLYLGKDNSNNKLILERIFNGEYKMCNSNFHLKDNDLYLQLIYDQPIIKTQINTNKIMGIDIGINRPATVFISGEKYQPKQITIGDKIQHQRNEIFRRKRQLQQIAKFSKGGHGTKRKTLNLVKLKEKEHNWATLMNHTISSEVINIAKQYGVGIIKMENLTGITKNKNDYFLKSWAFDQLQRFIKYKAELIGINVENNVDPQYTSQTCPSCRVANPLNRNDKDKTKFKCQNTNCDDFNKLKDADLVGAHNISLLDGSGLKKGTKAYRLEMGRLKKQNEVSIA